MIRTMRQRYLRAKSRRVAAVFALGALVGVPCAASAKEQAYADEIAALETEARAVMSTYEVDEQRIVNEWLARATAVAITDPQLATSLFTLALRHGVDPKRRLDVIIEGARAKAAIEDWQGAAAQFLEASEMAQDSHHLAPAVEGFIAAAIHLPSLGPLPAIDRYVAVVGQHGALDEAGYEALYTLGRHLARLHDPRSTDVLSRIPTTYAVGRRALYVLATAALTRGDLESARRDFTTAAALPALAEERDQSVRELCWLAVGRLAFEAGDTMEGYYAYQQISVDSPRFGESFLELGWLALEAGEESLAMLAFQPLAEVDPQSDIGRRAELLRGWVLLREGRYADAEAHYRSIAGRFEQQLGAFDEEIARVVDPADFVRDCEARRRALDNPLMRPFLARPEIDSARELSALVESVSVVGQALARQVDAIDALLTTDAGFVGKLRRDRLHIEELLKRTRDLAMRIDAVAARAQWLAAASPGVGQPQAPSDGCCQEPRIRVWQLRQMLEGAHASLAQREIEARSELEKLRREIQKAVADHQRLLARLTPEVTAAQRSLVEAGAAAARRDLHRMAAEGAAGVLEALWRYKEDHRELIRSLESERRQELALLDAELEAALAEIDAVAGN